MTGRRRRLSVEFDTVMAAHQQLAQFDSDWRAAGYRRTGARLFLCKNGTYTARAVWRHDTNIVSAITLTVRGIEFRS